jgi:hypothetical protein
MSNANQNATVVISQNELFELRELQKQIEIKKQKAVIASQKSREKRIAKMSDDEIELFREKNRIASKKSNDKKRNEIAQMKALIATLQNQQSQ